MVSRQIYEALVTRGLDMSIEPQLATGWTIESPTTWVFTLRKGVTFHDGSPLTASDAVFSFNRAKSKTSDFKEYIDSVTFNEAVGADKVKLVEGPNPILLNKFQTSVMSEACQSNNSAVPGDFNADEKTFASSNANGTGPFKITCASRTPRPFLKRMMVVYGRAQPQSHELFQLPIQPPA